MDQSLAALIQKYDTSGPRYTSYPPAPVFSKELSGEWYRRAIAEREAATPSNDLSLYFHIPFCDTLCHFCGCTTVITTNRKTIDQYVGYLKKEIELLAPLLNPGRSVIQLHWGGGTPTHLTPAQIRDLGAHIRKHFRISADAEVSVEIDPRELTEEHLRALREVGFNRISLGVQDFNPDVQAAVNRIQGEHLTHQTIDWARELGFSSVNVDLIYGLPWQTEASFSETLGKVIRLAPERIAVYNFAYVPWMKRHQVLIHPEDLPAPDTKLRILTSTMESLAQAGYVPIGMDHFARPDDELAVALRNHTLRRNFQGYSTRAGSDLYGLGMSSISHFGPYYAQNEKTLLEYYHAIAGGRFATMAGYEMTDDDRMRKDVIMQIMCDSVIDMEGVAARYGIVFEDYFAESLEGLRPAIDDGLVTAEHGKFVVSERGRFFLRNIAMHFDAHLTSMKKGRPLYSRTV
jgi:oxygen-independent coproporphyrinogen-3 oxidase